jgi:hypothetical protein
LKVSFFYCAFSGVGRKVGVLFLFFCFFLIIALFLVSPFSGVLFLFLSSLLRLSIRGSCNRPGSIRTA